MRHVGLTRLSQVEWAILEGDGVYYLQGSDHVGSLVLLCGFQLIIVGQASAIEEQNSFGRMAERSPGKDSVTGHWELLGLVLERGRRFAL